MRILERCLGGLALILPLTLAGCDQDEAVHRDYRAYRAALEAGDVDAIREHVAAEKRPSLDSPTDPATFIAMASVIPRDAEIRTTEVKGGRATLHVVAAMDDQEALGTVALVKEGGVWRVLDESWEIRLGGTAFGDWASGLRDGSIAAPTATRRWKAHEGGVIALAHTPEGALVSIGDDSRLRLWDSESGRLLGEARLPERPVDLAVVPRTGSVAVVDNQGVVQLWPIVAAGFGTPVRFEGRAGRMAHIAAAGDGATLATSSWDEPVQIWDVGKERSIERITRDAQMRGIAFPPRGRLLAVGNHGNQVFLWNLEKGTAHPKTYRVTKADPQSDVWTVAFSPDGKKLVTGHMDSSVSLWDAAKGRLIRDSYVRDASTFDAAFSPDGTLFATAHQNGRIVLWDAASGSQLGTLAGHDGAATAISFDPMAEGILASAGEDGTVVVWR